MHEDRQTTPTGQASGFIPHAANASPRRLARHARGALLVLAAFALAGCTVSPVAPQASAPGPAPTQSADPHIEAALSLILTTPAPLPWTGGSAAAWWAHTGVTGIKVQSLSADGSIRAQCCTGGEITVDPTSLTLTPVELAAVLMHEARHAEGYRHTCGSMDQSFAEGGAWAVSAMAYEWLGEPDRGAIVRAHEFCD
jgi:hypothetical protein